MFSKLEAHPAVFPRRQMIGLVGNILIKLSERVSESILSFQGVTCLGQHKQVIPCYPDY